MKKCWWMWKHVATGLQTHLVFFCKRRCALRLEGKIWRMTMRSFFQIFTDCSSMFDEQHGALDGKWLWIFTAFLVCFNFYLFQTHKVFESWFWLSESLSPQKQDCVIQVCPCLTLSGNVWSGVLWAIAPSIPSGAANVQQKWPDAFSISSGEFVSCLVHDSVKITLHKIFMKYKWRLRPSNIRLRNNAFIGIVECSVVLEICL